MFSVLKNLMQENLKRCCFSYLNSYIFTFVWFKDTCNFITTPSICRNIHIYSFITAFIHWRTFSHGLACHQLQILLNFWKIKKMVLSNGFNSKSYGFQLWQNENRWENERDLDRWMKDFDRVLFEYLVKKKINVQRRGWDSNSRVQSTLD
jgi:hypothetical protein